MDLYARKYCKTVRKGTIPDTFTHGHCDYGHYIKENPGSDCSDPGFLKTAATYSPNWWVSTIGDGELNFSVRNGKRWFLTAIATAIYDLREKTIGRR